MVILGMMIHGTMTTTSKNDYLSILGLSPDFDDKELKKAFRREARKWHPDLNKNDLNAEERFKLINEAYEYLRNPEVKKKNTDEKIQDDKENNNFKTGFPDFQDYLDSLFGYEYSPKNNEEYDNEPFADESININNDEFNNYEYPTTSPEEPPPVKLHQDIETIIELTMMRLYMIGNILDKIRLMCQVILSMLYLWMIQLMMAVLV